MKHFKAKVSVLALVALFGVSAAWSQQQMPAPGQQGQQAPAQGQQGAQQPGAQGGQGQGGRGGQGAARGPVVSKEETAAYKLLFDARNGDPMHIIDLGEAFVAKYPMSFFVKSVYAE